MRLSYRAPKNKNTSGTYSFEYEYEYETEVSDGEYDYFYFDVEASYRAGIEYNADCDADGNRGRERGWIEDIEFIILLNKRDITDLIEKSEPELFKSIETEVEEKANEGEGSD